MHMKSSASQTVAFGLLVLALLASIGGVYLGQAWARQLVAAVALAWLAVWLVVVGGAPLPNGVRRALWALLAALLVSSLASTEIAVSLDAVALALALVAVVALVSSLAPEGALWHRSILLLLFAGLLTLMVGVYFYWAGSGDIHGLFGNKNHFAGYLLLLLPLSLSLFLSASGRRELLAYGLTAVLLATGLLLSQSRGAWIAALPALGLVIWLRRRAAGLWGRLLAVTVLAIALALLINSTALQGAVTVGSLAVRDVAAATSGAEPAGTLGPRLDYWRGALGIARDHPWLGTGPGTFGNAYPAYQSNPVNYSRYAHQILLQTLAEAGVLGLAALLWLLAVTGVVVWRSRVWDRVQEVALAQVPQGAAVVGLAGGLVGSLTHNLLELDWYVPAIAVLAAVEAGLLLSTASADTARGVPGTEAHGQASAWLRLERWCMLALCLGGLIWTGLRTVEQQQMNLGRAAQTRNDLSTASDYYRLAAMINPVSPEPQKALAALALPPLATRSSAVVIPGGGLAAARWAVTVDSLDVDARVLLARHYEQRGQPGDNDLARQELSRAALLRHPSQAPAVYLELGQSYQAAGSLDEALSVYAAIVADYATLTPGSDDARVLAQAHVLMGNIAAQRGDVNRATTEYQAALTADPTSSAAHFNLGVLAYDQGDLAQARVSLGQAVKLAPDQVVARYFYGLALAATGDAAGAREQWQAALTLDPACGACQEQLDRLNGK